MNRKLVTYFPIAVLAVGLVLGMAAALMALRPTPSAPPASADISATAGAVTVTLSNRTSARSSTYLIRAPIITNPVANGNTVVVTFPAGTTVPGTIATSAVSVGDGGSTPDPKAAAVAVAGLAVTITIPTGIDNDGAGADANANTIDVGDTLVIIFGGDNDPFLTNAGIVNPTVTTTTNQTLTVSHSAGGGAQTSANYVVQYSEVINSPRTAGDLVELQFNFHLTNTVSAALTANIGEIKITFDKDTQIPASIPRSNVLIQANTLTNVPGGTGADLVSTTGANMVVSVPFDPTTEIDTADPERKILTIKVPDMNQADTSAGEGAQGIAGGANVTVTFTTGAGIKNATFEDGFLPISTAPAGSGYVLLARNSAAGTNLIDSGTSVTAPVDRRIIIGSTDGERGTRLNVTGKGFRRGLTVTGWLDQPGAAIPNNIRDVGESDLFTVTAASDDTFTATFTVSNPPFKPGNKNYIAAVDGRANPAPFSQVNGAKFELRGKVEVSPTTLSLGDTMTITVKDFDASVDLGSATPLSGYTSKPFFKLGGIDVTVSTGTTTDSTGEKTFTARVPNGVPLGTQALETQFACCAGGGGSATTTRRTTLTIGGATLIITPDTVVPNQTINIVGNDFSTSDVVSSTSILRINETDPNSATPVTGCTKVSSMSIQGAKIPQNKINEGNAITIAAGGNWSASVIVPTDATTTSGGTYDFKVVDCHGREGVAKLTISRRTMAVNPTEALVGSIITVTGSGYAAKNDRTGNYASVTVTIKYDGGANATTSVTAEPDASGNIRGTLTVPTNTNIPSTNTLSTTYTAQDNSQVVTTVTHDVPRAKLVIAPSTGRPGTKVTATLSGAKAFTTISTATIGASLDVKPAPTPFTDGTGSLVFDFIVPQMEIGVQNLEVKIGTTTASAAFTVESAVAVPPTGTPPSGPQTVANAIGTALGADLVRLFNFNNQTKTWTFFDPRPEFKDLNTLKEVNSGQTYWINAANDKSITFCGRTVTLYKGWNLNGC